MGRMEDLIDNEYPPVAIYHVNGFPDYCEKMSPEHCVIKAFFLPAAKEGRSICGNPKDIRCGGPASGFCLSMEHDGILKEAYSVKNGYFDSPERVVNNYFEALPVPFTRDDLIVFEPLSKAIGRGKVPEVVVYLADPLHISALMTLAGYCRKSNDSPVDMRFALGCENIYLMPMLEESKDDPRCVIGFTEFYVRKFVDPDKFSFSIPYSLYKRMEAYADDTFLTKVKWNRSD